MDLFSSITNELPGPNDPGFKGIESSICNRARNELGYYDFSYAQADRVYYLHWELILKEYRETNKPFTADSSARLLIQAIKEIYKHG